jgi:hypothetical protein
MQQEKKTNKSILIDSFNLFFEKVLKVVYEPKQAII